MASEAGGWRVAGQRFSLVLGAGGRPGLAFHAGALLALQAHGVPADSAATITGTSAGAIATAIVAAEGAVETSSTTPARPSRAMSSATWAT